MLPRLHQQINANNTNVSLYLQFKLGSGSLIYVAAANHDFARFNCFLSLTVFQTGKILSLIASFSKSLLTQLSVAGN